MNLAIRFICMTVPLFFLTPSACAQARNVTVNVTITNSIGEPVQSQAVVLRGSNGVKAGAVTDAEGHAILAGSLLLTDQAASVRLSAGNDLSPEGNRIFFGPNRDALRFQIGEYFRSHCARWDRTLELHPETESYSSTIIVSDCIQVHGAVAPPTAIDNPAVAFSSSMCFPSSDEDNQEFRVCVERGQNNQLLVIRSDEDPVKLLALAAADLNENYDVGTVVFDPINRDAAVRATVTQLSTYWNLIGVPDIQGLTYVNAVDGMIWTRRGKLVRIDGGYGATFESLSLPAGTYYIAPGWCDGSAIQFALIDAVRRGDDLTNSGVPKVTAIAGQTVNVEVDLAAAYAACHNLRRP